MNGFLSLLVICSFRKRTASSGNNISILTLASVCNTFIFNYIGMVAYCHTLQSNISLPNAWQNSGGSENCNLLFIPQKVVLEIILNQFSFCFDMKQFLIVSINFLHLNVSILKYFSSYGLMISTTHKDKHLNTLEWDTVFPLSE